MSIEEIQSPETRATAVFAGGCFWCVEAVFEPLKGVDKVVSGYAGGSARDASYDLVASGQTEHAEAVEVTYDPSVISYSELLRVFFSTHNPTSGGGQHPDYGPQYRPAVFYANDDEKRVAQAYIEQLDASGRFDQPIATRLEPLEKFYPAEDYHQDFVEKNPRHPYVQQWSTPKLEKLKKQFPELLEGAAEVEAGPVDRIQKSEAEWREQLSDEQFRVLRKEGTEPAGSSPLNREKRPGMFTCAGCGLALFDSDTKYESGSGWPSFYDAVEGHVAEQVDTSHGMRRVEVECARCGGHLGHVFEDGPKPTGLRYCINGVSLDFEPEGE